MSADDCESPEELFDYAKNLEDDLLTDACKDYLRRLIIGVRKEMVKDPETIEAKAALGDEIMVHRWVDAELLCMTIEKDVLK